VHVLPIFLQNAALRLLRFVRPGIAQSLRSRASITRSLVAASELAFV
jgi:hypothetical protein